MEIDDMKWTCQHSTNQTKLLRIFFFQKILNIWYIYQYLSEVQCTKLRYVKKKPPDIFTTYSNQKSNNKLNLSFIV